MWKTSDPFGSGVLFLKDIKIQRLIEVIITAKKIKLYFIAVF